MKRIIVIGSPGSGKSYFSRKLAELTGLPLYHLDMLWHKSDRTTVSREEFDDGLHQILQEDEWIIDGSYSRTLEMRLEKCDTVFYFDLPTELCLAGVRERIGKPREDMPWIETEFDPEFYSYIEEFKKNRKPRIDALLEKHGSSYTLYTFGSREAANEYLKSLKVF